MRLRKKDFPNIFFEVVGQKLERSVPLRDYSHFKIGGNTDYFFSASSINELEKVVLLARDYSFPFYIIGGGFNCLFDDSGFRGLIIQNCAKGVKVLSQGGIETDSGTPLRDLLHFCVGRGLGGLEFLAGIPGTVGGAVYGNAGAFHQNIGECLTEAVILKTGGNIVQVDQEYFSFDYRDSLLKSSGDILLTAVLKAQMQDLEKIKAKIKENLENREKKHPPWDVPCAGSFFKNPQLPSGEKVPAARLLEKVGAKYLEVGGAAVFKNHANFIINRGNACAKDVLRLASVLKKRVKQEFNVGLEEEVIVLPAKPRSF